MSLRVQRSERSRHLLLRGSAGELLPDGLIAKLRDEQVACGWLRASGVVVDVELRAFDPELGSLGSTRRIAGSVHLVSLEGAIGLVAGQPSVSLRALLARETDRGLETFAGEIASARTIALEALVTVLDDVAAERAFDESAGVWLFGGPAAAGGPRPPPAAAPARAPAPSAWSAAVEASEEAQAEAPAYPRDRAPARTSPAQVPQRPARPALDLDSPMPEPGDRVDHFAFGRCDVLKSDGDRLHLKVHKDGRIREIALEMLRVTREEDSDGKRRFKLERRI